MMNFHGTLYNQTNDNDENEVNKYAQSAQSAHSVHSTHSIQSTHSTLHHKIRNQKNIPRVTVINRRTFLYRNVTKIVACR
jgi:hypothetical protein